MASPATAPHTAAAPSTDERLAAILERMVDNAPVKRLTFDEWYERQPVREMPFPVYQNGYQLDADMLTDAQLALLPKLKVGRFFERRIHVYRDATPDRGWHITYPCKQLSDRMVISQYGRDFTEILQRLTTETPDLT